MFRTFLDCAEPRNTFTFNSQGTGKPAGIVKHMIPLDLEPSLIELPIFTDSQGPRVRRQTY